MNKFEAPSLSVEELSAALYNANLQLQQTNEQLKEKSAALEQANTALVEKSAALEQANTALVEKSAALEQANTALVEKSAALEQANAALVEKTDKLIASDRARTEMFANISHDLRSPITAIKSSIEYLLSMENLSEEEQREYLQLMNTRVGIMEDFINDIFLLATLESKSVSLKTTELDITALLEEFYCECEVNPRFEKRVLSFDMEDYTPIMVNVDVKQFLRVLDNLFNNALKYSGDGDEISLSVEYIGGETVNLSGSADPAAPSTGSFAPTSGAVEQSSASADPAAPSTGSSAPSTGSFASTSGAVEQSSGSADPAAPSIGSFAPTSGAVEQSSASAGPAAPSTDSAVSSTDSAAPSAGSAGLSKGEVRISVSDTGIGIKEADIPHIFDRSFMAQRARTPDAKTGFGLGLCITKEIVKLHGGEITCESTFGYGSTFTIVLPAGRK